MKQLFLCRLYTKKTHEIIKLYNKIWIYKERFLDVMQ